MDIGGGIDDRDGFLGSGADSWQRVPSVVKSVGVLVALLVVLFVLVYAFW